MFSMIVTVCSGAASIITLLLLVLKPVREKLWGLKAMREAMQCSLRQDILHTYYTNKANKTIRQYEKENFLKQIDAYYAIKGNSFVQDIEREVREWEVIS